MDFVALDLETANNSQGGIAEIGAILVKDNEIVDSFNTLVNPETPLNPFEMRSNGIDPEDLQSAPLFPQAVQMLPSWFFSHPFVAHNASFDGPAFKRAADRYGIKLPGMNFFCTKLTAEFCLKLPDFHLETVASSLNIPLENHHCALYDAECAANIAIYFLENNIELRPYIPGESSGSSVRKRKPQSKEKSAVYPDCAYYEGPIDIQGSVFRFSGKMPGVKTSALEEAVKELNGQIGYDPKGEGYFYLVVGKENPSITHGEGGKSNAILSAEKKIAQGKNVRIVRADHFLSCLNQK